MAKTRIIATLGPASSSGLVIRRMARAGLAVARLNCSHSAPEALLAYLRLVRKASRACGRRLRILLDLEGPRIRVGKLKHHRPLLIRKGQVLWLVRGDAAGEGNRVPLNYDGPLDGIEGAEHVYVDDGNVCLKIVEVGEHKIKTRVVRGDSIKEYKGINIPGARLQFPLISAKDEEDVRLGVEQGVDWIAQSFVRDRQDLIAIRERMRKDLPSPRLIAKIENRDGIRNIDEIIEFSDGIMVARGDMGVSVPIYEVPVIQKQIIRKCNQKGKPVITATQMLESMVEHFLPTRAEVADVANAILDGTDFVMLSAESAVGKYPVEAVRMMSDIIAFTEKAAARDWSELDLP